MKNGNKNVNKNKNNKTTNSNLINVEHSQNSVKTNGTKSPIISPKTSQNFVTQQQAPKSATIVNKNESQQNSLKSSSPPPPSNNDNNHNDNSNNLSSNKNITTTTTQQKTRSIPKPLNLSKTTQFQNLGRGPQTATFPQKINRNYSLPSPPKTATFPKNSYGFTKDITQPALKFSSTTPSTNNPQHSYALMCSEQYLNNLELARLRHYNSNLVPVRFTTDSQGSSQSTPRFLPSENLTGSADLYDLYNTQYYPYEVCEDELFLEDGQQYYNYYYNDQPPQECISPSTLNLKRSNTKDERRKSVFGGPMKVHPDAILPIRQPKGPEMTKNFTTRIRRKAVNKLYAAAAERRSRSAADRRKSAMF